jgi:hypothetical protein
VSNYHDAGGGLELTLRDWADWHVIGMAIALSHAQLGRSDKASEWRQKACEARSSGLVLLDIRGRVDLP